MLVYQRVSCVIYHWNSLNFHCQNSVARGRCHIWELRCLGARTCPAPGQKNNHQEQNFPQLRILWDLEMVWLDDLFIKNDWILVIPRLLVTRGWLLVCVWNVVLFSGGVVGQGWSPSKILDSHVNVWAVFTYQIGKMFQLHIRHWLHSPDFHHFFSSLCCKIPAVSAAEEFVGQSRHLSLATASLWRQLLRQVAREFGVQQHWDGLLAAQLDGFWCGYPDFTGCFWNRSQRYKWVPKFVLHGIKFFEELQFSAWF